MSQTLFDKIWKNNTVTTESEHAPAILYVDLHLLHEVTSPQAFDFLKQHRLNVFRPDRCLATLDHAVPTLPPDSAGRLPYVSKEAAKQVEALRQNCLSNGIILYDWDSPHRGIVHVIGPELGYTQPGMTVVCGDSHTSTHGAFGALAFGIGTTEVGHVLATQCVLQTKPGTMRIQVNGELNPFTSAKDVSLHIIGKIGVDGATGCVIEYCGPVIRAMDMEARMTLCNMSIECGAKAGMIAPDETTFSYLKDRPFAPQGDDWNLQLNRWKQLYSDPDARFDASIDIDTSQIKPGISWGTNPGMVIPVGGDIPQNDKSRPSSSRALKYMGLKAGSPLKGQAVDVVFIGSCTNARITDLRTAAEVMQNNKTAVDTRVIIVPGSEAVKRQAEEEGIDRIFVEAGAQWRNPGCSMCVAMNGDLAQPGEMVVSTSNRNFEGRQGPGARTLLASPLTAAICAITGVVTDPIDYMANHHEK
jgi:3-isopropylmalate/(R)-2-methylmalate dehydratase large subunit